MTDDLARALFIKDGNPAHLWASADYGTQLHYRLEAEKMDKPSEMVERVAAVILSLDSDSLPDFYERMLKSGRGAEHCGDCTNMPITCNRCVYDEATAKARRVIEAMREPTERMIVEGESAASVGIGKPTDEHALPRVWQYMIDAAISS